SGWLAQLYPFMQKWNIKQRFIMLSAKRNMKYLWDSARNMADRRRNNGGYQQAKASIATSLPSGEVVTTSSAVASPEHYMDAYHRSPSSLVKQSSVNSTTTDIDSGLSMESKNFLDDQEQEEEELEDAEELDDQTRMMIDPSSEMRRSKRRRHSMMAQIGGAVGGGLGLAGSAE